MILERLKDIPKNSGCYLFKNNKGQIIYVGMSKFLPKRVSSYFQKNQTGKTKTLVENIHDVEFKITSSEQEAIILEEELIKLYKPKFNIKGKDNKTRKWSLCFTDEEFPKLEIVRDKQDDRVSLDFTSGMLCREVYDLIHDIFELRSCSYDLTEENILKEKFKNCLDHEINKKSLIKITSYPCWFIEGQSDYHTLKLLDGDFENHKNNFLENAYVPYEWKKRIKLFSIEEWKDKIIKDSPFEGVPITHQYWSGFFIYEYLIKSYGVDLVMEVMLDFPKTIDFDKSMEKILKINTESFYDTISIMLFNLAKMVRTG